MVFEGEDVSLKEDILKPLPKEFVKTWAEWASDKKIQVRRSGSGVNSFTLFTVPKNQTLFVTNAFLSMDGVAIVGVAPVASIDIAGQGGSLLRHDATTNRAQDVHMTTSFPMPVKVNEGEGLRAIVSPGSNTFRVTAGIMGFLVDKLVSGREFN